METEFDILLKNMGAVVRGNIKKALYKSLQYSVGIIFFLIFQSFIIIYTFIYFNHKYEIKFIELKYKIEKNKITNNSIRR